MGQDRNDRDLDQPGPHQDELDLLSKMSGALTPTPPSPTGWDKRCCGEVLAAGLRLRDVLSMTPSIWARSLWLRLRSRRSRPTATTQLPEPSSLSNRIDSSSSDTRCRLPCTAAGRKSSYVVRKTPQVRIVRCRYFVKKGHQLTGDHQGDQKQMFTKTRLLLCGTALTGVIWAGTFAQFTDSGTASSTFTAGTVDLLVGGATNDAYALPRSR